MTETCASLAAGAAGRADLPSALGAFVTTVVTQVARPLGAPRLDAAEQRDREHRIAERLAAILHLACGDADVTAGHDGAIDRAAALLAADVPLLSACFQNTDLLPHAGAPAADAVALVVLRAMEQLAATPAPDAPAR